MRLARRRFITGLALVAGLAAAGPALALSESQAKDHVRVTLEELKALLQSPGSGSSRAPQLRRIMETRANVPLIARFSAGVSWRSMDASQQKRFTEAFSHYISVVYARRFDEYAGNPQFEIGNAVDAGKKGILVDSPIQIPNQGPVNVQWLVSDRGGRVEIIDLVIENISMLQTQREEIGAMFERRGGDVEAMIAHLDGIQ